jgi:hypothetical protein
LLLSAILNAEHLGKEDIARLAAATAIPFLPLLLTLVSPEELIMRVAKVVLP